MLVLFHHFFLTLDTKHIGKVRIIQISNVKSQSTHLLYAFLVFGV